MLNYNEDDEKRRRWSTTENKEKHALAHKCLLLASQKFTSGIIGAMFMMLMIGLC